MWSGLHILLTFVPLLTLGNVNKKNHFSEYLSFLFEVVIRLGRIGPPGQLVEAPARNIELEDVEEEDILSMRSNHIHSLRIMIMVKRVDVVAKASK